MCYVTKYHDPTNIAGLIYSRSAKVDKSLADEFKSNQQTPMKLIHVGIYTAIGVGAFLDSGNN